MDLIAAQVAKQTATLKLRDILNQIASGGGSIPASTLESIWKTLQERQKLVLRTMAEADQKQTTRLPSIFAGGSILIR